MRVLQLLEHGFGERNLRKGSELLAGRIDPEVFDGFLDAEEVASHNLTGTLLVGRWLESAVLNQPYHLYGKVVAL